MALLFIPVTQIKDNLGLQIFIFTLLIFITLAQHVFFLRFLNYYLDIVIITNYRIIDLKKSLFIHDEKEIIDLHEIQDTQKMQTGIFPNFLNYGDIKIVVPSMTRAMVLPYMPRPEYYLNQINQLDISEKDLKKKITKFRQDEIDHKDIAYDEGATKKGPYFLLDKVIKTGSKIAINISEKI